MNHQIIFSRALDERYVADIELRRARAEIEVLASVASSPRLGMMLLCEAGIDASHFRQDDTSALYVVFLWAADPLEPPRERARVACLARDLLRSLGYWDETDGRSFVTGGSRWGPGPLAALMTRIEYRPETVRLAIERLLDIDAEQQRLFAEAEGRRCA